MKQHARHKDVTSITTLREWETAVLTMLGAPLTKDNYAFLNAWVKREGGGGRNNPLNTTQHETGSTSFNSVGVQNYPSLLVGAEATYRTLQYSYYTDVVSALRSGHPSRTRSYRGLHTWSGGGYSNLAGISTGSPSLSNISNDTSSDSRSVGNIDDVAGWIESHVALLVILLVVLLLLKR